MVSHRHRFKNQNLECTLNKCITIVGIAVYTTVIIVICMMKLVGEETNETIPGIEKAQSAFTNVDLRPKKCKSFQQATEMNDGGNNDCNMEDLMAGSVDIECVW